MKVKDKLDGFSKIAIREAEEKREEYLRDMDNQYIKACEDIKQKAQRNASQILSEEAYKAEQMCNREVLEASKQAKHSLIELRTQLTNDLFQGVKAMLADYVETQEYADSLVKEIKALTADFPDGITVYVCDRDMLYADRIKAVKGVTLEQGSDDMIAGFQAKAVGQNIFIDSSYKKRLEEVQSSFNGFKITN